MKNFYIENFALRLIVCIACFYAVWFFIQFLLHTFLLHEPMTVRLIDIVVPLAGGIAEAFVWKPKDTK